MAFAVEAGEGYSLWLVTLSDGSRREIKLPKAVSEPGGMEWSGERLWVGAILSESKAAEGAAGQDETAKAEGDTGDGTADVALLMVDTTRGEVKVRPLGKGLDSAATLQPAVSPDGKFLAVALLGGKDENAPGLLIWDLAMPDEEPVAVPRPAVSIESTAPAVPALESTGR